MRLLLLLSILLLIIRFYFTGRIFIIEDEAYYWFWAEHLSWGYPEHPPLVAWLIAIFKDILPAWKAIQFFDVRLGGVLLSMILFLVCYDWGYRLQHPYDLQPNKKNPPPSSPPQWVFPSFDKEKISLPGTVFATLSQIIPYYYGTFFLITPDTPMVFMIFLTLYFYYRGIFENQKFFYFGGVALGLSLLAKLTSLLPALGMLVFFLTSPITRKKLFEKTYFLHLATSVLIGFMIFLPYLLWNIKHNFPVLNNLSRLMFVPAHLNDFIGFWGEQAVLYFPLFLPLLIMLPFVELLKTILGKKNIAPNTSTGYLTLTNIYQQKKYFLLWVSLIPLLYFFYKSTQSYLRINWMGSAFMGSTALLALWFTEHQERWRRLKPLLFTITIIFTLLISSLLYVTDKKFAPLNIIKSQLTAVYPKYEIFFDSYLMYDFFQRSFSEFYKKNMNKKLPIVSHNYQIPSIVNYYLRPEREAFGIASTNDYHLMTYYFLPEKDYAAELSGSYYLLLRSHHQPDKSILKWDEKGQTLTRVKRFFIRQSTTKNDGDFDLYLVE